MAFFATGYFSGFGAVTAEIYPTAIRATAQGFTYNMGRIASALAPFAVGSLAQNAGSAPPCSLTSAAFLLAAVTWIWIPETRGLSSERAWRHGRPLPGHVIRTVRVKRLTLSAEGESTAC